MNPHASPAPAGSARFRPPIRRPRLVALGAAGLVLCASGIASAGPGSTRPAKEGRTTASGDVYAATNALTGNAIRTFHRNADGTLKVVGDTATGGAGSGAFEQSSNAVVLGGLAGESSPNNLLDAEQLLFAVNTGSNTVSVLRADGDKPVLIGSAPTGLHPLSVTVNRGLVYVLNGGAPAAMGGLPSITGFRLSRAGVLTPIPGSTQAVSGGPLSGAAQISFNPDGTVLVVTEKVANVLTSYQVGRDGVAGPAISNPNAPGSIGPFGFTFTRDGVLLTAQNAGGAPGQGGAGSFSIGSDGRLTPVGPGTVANGQNDTCWVIITDDGRYAYATNAQSNNISSYTVDATGTLTLLKGDAALTDELPAVGPSVLPADITFSRDSRYLIERNVMDGDINSYAVADDGSLTLVQRLDGALPIGAIGVAGT
ncbi:MAG: beta-propeller fold lactonase family protein [Actinobacteria bacterium]|nr:beta-propeller fold lactonase family protein [Actinomycetota bacterium]